MTNQIALAGTLVSDLEVILYALKVGSDPHKVWEVIKGGFAASTQWNLTVPRALSGDLQPGFYIKHFIKDMKIALREANKVSYDPQILHKVCDMYEELEKRGMGDLGTQAIIQYYEKA